METIITDKEQAVSDSLCTGTSALNNIPLNNFTEFRAYGRSNPETLETILSTLDLTSEDLTTFAGYEAMISKIKENLSKALSYVWELVKKAIKFIVDLFTKSNLRAKRSHLTTTIKRLDMEFHAKRHVFDLTKASNMKYTKSMPITSDLLKSQVKMNEMCHIAHQTLEEINKKEFDYDSGATFGTNKTITIGEIVKYANGNKNTTSNFATTTIDAIFAMPQGSMERRPFIYKKKIKKFEATASRVEIKHNTSIYDTNTEEYNKTHKGILDNLNQCHAFYDTQERLSELCKDTLSKYEKLTKPSVLKVQSDEDLKKYIGMFGYMSALMVGFTQLTILSTKYTSEIETTLISMAEEYLAQTKRIVR